MVMQRIANPSTPVRFRLPPPSITADTVFPGGVAECFMRQGVQAPYRPVKIRAPASRIYPCRFLLSSRDKARVVKLVDTTGLKNPSPPDTGRTGSIPVPGTNQYTV